MYLDFAEGLFLMFSYYTEESHHMMTIYESGREEEEARKPKDSAQAWFGLL